MATSMNALKYGFLTKGKPRSVKPILVLRDNTNVYTATRWDRQEFIYTLRFGYWPPDMLICDMDADQLYIVRGNEYNDNDYGPQQVLPLPYSVDDLPARERNLSEQFGLIA